MAIVDYQAVIFLVLIILLHLSPRNIQDQLAFFHDTLHADLITLVTIVVMLTDMAFIFKTKWFDITTETFPEHISTLVLNIADKMDVLSFGKENLHFNQLIKGLKTSNHFQRKYTGDDLSNNTLSGLYINKLVSINCAMEQQTEAFVKDFGDLSRTVFVVVERPDVEEGDLFDIFYDNPLIPNLRLSLHQDEGEKKSDVMKQKRRERFSLLSRRLETFTNSKLSADAKRFAESGFFFCGKLDRVCCYECGIIISKWKKDDDPLLEHFRHSLDCPFVVSLLTEDLRHDIREQLKNARRNESSNRETGLKDKLRQELIEDLQKENKCAKKSARFPKYQFINVRLATFGKFPNDNGIGIQDIARAGFYYTGINDLVKCYWCGLGLKDWEYGDDPYKEHARFLPDCDHLRKVKGEDFIMHIKEKDLHVPKETVCSPSVILWELVGTDRKEVQNKSSDNENASTNLLYTDAAQMVLELGYTDELVLAAIRTLNITDDTKLTANQILEVIFDAEENGTDLAEKNTKYESQKYQSKNVQSPNEEPKQQEAELELNTPAALAVQDFGYSRKATSMAINELKKRGKTTFTADGILQVLVSFEDRGISLPADDDAKENDSKNSILSDLQKVSPQDLPSEERLSKRKTNKTVTSETIDKEVRHPQEENEKLAKQMMCKRCKARQRNILVLPCTHFCLCEQCSKEVSLCPECWKPIKERVKTYVL